MNESYTQTILKAISKALNSGSNDIFIVIFSVLFVILLIILSSVSIKLKSKREVTRSALSTYHKLVRKFNLTVLEMDLIDKLSEALLYPEKKYLLLKNKGTFKYAVQRIDFLREENIELINSLTEKLGFSSSLKPENVLSTKDLKPGHPVKLSRSNNRLLTAEVYSVSESSITIKYAENSEKIIRGEHLKLYLCAFNGFKIYKLTAAELNSNVFSSRHVKAEKIEKSRINFKVIIKNEREHKIEVQNTNVVLITEKGAMLLNTPNRLKPGDDIRIYFNNDLKHRYHVNAEVVKAPITSKLVSVRFTHICE